MKRLEKRKDEPIYSKHYHILWYEINDKFFNGITDKRIRNEIKREYEYITSLNQNPLLKPNCKYFESCNNNLKISNFKVFPNPIRNEATISFDLPNAVDGDIILHDITGKTYKTILKRSHISSGSHQIDVSFSGIKSGIYIISFFTDNGIHTQRLVISQ